METLRSMTAAELLSADRGHRPSRAGAMDLVATLALADWTIAELAAHDPDYLEWLARAPAGLTFRQEIYTQLAKRAAAYPSRTATATRPQPSGSRFRPRRLW